FEPFFTTKQPGRGTGQGLAISRSIVTQHAGKLWFETELERGTTFFVQLPVESTEPTAQPTERAA
ncbi:MAG TPA: HAMP domain-containing sensor histidine kinase, partial [Polyangiaceae bacterium]|nr:HAMP domain-containing sensor histidine kinase [Polyangiaceae bacterium]